MVIRVAVVEDDPSCQKTASEYLARYGKEKNVTWNIKCFDNSAEFAFSYCAAYDIILLDIEMPLMNGLDVARRIRKTDSNVIIVFITNLANYAVQGYEVEALDFIVKPYTYETFRFRMDRIVNRIEAQSRNSAILVNAKDQTYRVEISRLIYVEVDHHALIYHTQKEDISIRGSMKEVESILVPMGFCKCSQSYLLNLRYVTRIEKDTVYLRDIPIHISRGSKKELIQALTEYSSSI